jgi:hypothetical protein
MKTLREYIDQLDEIDRRGFLKGMGAAAVAGATGGAIGQTIGAGENESAWAAGYSNNMWQSLAKDNNSYNKWIYDTVKKYATEYFQYSNGVNFQDTIKTAVLEAYTAVRPDFDMFYKIVDKEKEDTSLLGTYMKNRIGNRLGIDIGGQAAQQKYAGSMKQFDLRHQAETFVGEYKKILNKTLQSVQQQPRQQSAEIAPIFKPENANLNRALSIYYYGKESNQQIAGEMAKGIAEYITATNQKDFVNASFKEIKKILDNMKSANPEQYEDLKNKMFAYYKTSLQQLKQMSDSAGPEFKESVAEQDLEEASPDAVKRIEQLVRYK